MTAAPIAFVDTAIADFEISTMGALKGCRFEPTTILNRETGHHHTFSWCILIFHDYDHQDVDPSQRDQYTLETLHQLLVKQLQGSIEIFFSDEERPQFIQLFPLHYREN